MGEHTTKGRKVKTVQATFEILETIRRENGPSLDELDDILPMSKSTIFNHVNTLEELRVVYSERGRYYIGLGMVKFGTTALSRLDLPQMLEPEIKHLVKETDGRCVVMVEENNQGVCIYQRTSEKSVVTDKDIGEQFDLHCTALGKAYLSALSRKTRTRKIKELDLDRKTDYTITDEDELLADLEKAAERGYAVNNQERVKGMRAIGAPIVTQDGNILGAISVSIPITRMRGERFREDIPNLVMDAASVISVKKAYGQLH